LGFRIGAAAACTSDCNGNGEVTIDELIRGVNIALGHAPAATRGEGTVVQQQVGVRPRGQRRQLLQQLARLQLAIVRIDVV
jgi:hypothetical protein